MISSSTLGFLKELAKNNHREWFQAHKHEHEAAKDNVLTFAADLIHVLSKIDPTIPSDLDPKTCIMRIYRDIRFSKDKTPFKTNFGMAISANGKNFHGPGYYLHIEPGKSFVAGGAWFPDPENLKAIRQEIDYNSSDFHEVIGNPEFKNLFGELNSEGKLKTVPKGYSSDHQDIEYLKLKSFTVTRNVSDKQLTDPGAAAEIGGMFEKLYPFMVFLRNAIS